MEVRATSGEGGAWYGPLSARTNCSLSLLPLHSFSVTLRTPFWIQALDLRLSRLLFGLRSWNFVKRGECHSHLPFVSFTVGTFQGFVSNLAFKPAEEEVLCKAMGIKDDKEPVGTFTAPDTSAFEDLVSAVKIGTDANTFAQSGRPMSLCDAVQFLKEHAPQPADAAVASATELSQAVAQVAEAVREVRASTSQRVRVCDHLDPMDRLEVEPPSMRDPVFTLCHEPYADFARLTL